MAAVRALKEARQRLTLAHVDRFRGLGDQRNRWEFRLLLDWYVLLDRSQVMTTKDTTALSTDR